MSARKESSIRGKQPPESVCGNPCEVPGARERYVIGLPRIPASRLPSATADLRKIRRVICSIQQGLAERQAIVQRLERTGGSAPSCHPPCHACRTRRVV